MTKNFQNNSDQLLGIVLCGGTSSRMGTDKGLLPLKDTIWARVVAAKMEALSIPVVFSINQSQIASYEIHIGRNQLIIDLPSADGPLRGLLTAWSLYPDRDFLLLACDMLDLHIETIDLLLVAYRKGEADFYAYRAENYFEPVCAIYTAKGLNKIFNSDKRPCENNLQSILQNGKTKIVKAIKEETFNNYNSKRSFKEYRLIL